MRTGDLISGRYRLEALLGAGGNGVVWSAFDTTLERAVALKRPHSVRGDAERVVFRREAKHAAQLHHPNAISVFDAVDTDDCWLVMEYLPSESLDKIVAAHGPLPPERVARIGLQIAAALHAAHAKGLVHRDVKPGNILVADGDLAKLTDFGISVWREVTLTGDGKISGTPAYVAPEVANCLPATAASDVFSLGATLFAAVEGGPPFGGGTPDAVLARARRGQIADTHRAGPLAPLLAEMLEGRRGHKRPTADEVRQRLKEYLGAWEPPQISSPATPSHAEAGSADPDISTPQGRRHWWRALAAVAAIGVLIVVTFAIVRNIDPDTPAESATPISTSAPKTSSSTNPTTAPSTTTTSTPAATPRPEPPPPTRSTRQPTEPAPQPSASPPPKACRQREQYRVTVRGEVHNAAGDIVGAGEAGDLFVRLDTPANSPPDMSDRYYGTVNGATGYFLQRKLDFVGTVPMCG